MKQTLTCVLLSLITYTAHADSWMLFRADAVENSINAMVEPEYRQSAATEYETQMSPTDGKITAAGILSVCAAAGWDITTNNGFYFCRGFVDNIADLSGVSSDVAKQCKQMNGIRTVSSDGTEQCIGRDGTVLVYSNACRGDNGECIKVFASTRTQVPNAKELIYQYGNLHNLNLTCSNEIVDIHKLGSDYIQCSANNTAYEFQFDTLNQSYNQRMVDSENTALCEMFGGMVVGDDEYWTMCSLERAACDRLSTFAASIGHSAIYQGNCQISRTVNTRDNIFLNHIDGVDSYVFYDIKIRSGVAKPMVEQYLSSIFPDEDNIKCGPDIVELNDPTSLGTNWIMQCTVGIQTVDFVFKELAESADYKSDAGAAQMSCVINGGMYEGKACRGLNQDECISVGPQIPGGARWDDATQTCILNDAARAQTINNLLWSTGGAIIAIGTVGGGTIPVLVAVAGGVVFDAAFFGLGRLQEVYPHHVALEFVEAASGCNDATCAYNIVQSYFNRLNKIAENLTDDELDAIANQIDKVSGLLTDSDFTDAIQSSGLNASDLAMRASTPLLFAVGLFAAPENIMRQLTSKAPRFASRIAKMSDNMLTVANKSNILSRYGAVLRRGSENSLGYDYYRIIIDDTNPNLSRIIDDLQQEGFFISSNTTINGQKFLAVSDRNIFSAWNNSPSNWLMAGRTSITDFGADIAAKSGRTAILRQGSARGYDYYRVDINGLSRNQVQQIMNNLRNSGYDDVFIMQAGDEFVLSVSNPTIRGGKAINNSGIQQYGLEYISRTPNANQLPDFLQTFRQTSYHNSPIYVDTRMFETASDADKYVERIMLNSNGQYYAAQLGTVTSRPGDHCRYVVAVIQKSDADKMGYIWDGNRLIQQIDNSNALRNLDNIIGKPITTIRGNPVIVESIDDFGTVSGRAIIMVKVKGKKLPFYISTGSAGKTTVPTGKWEFFGGIEPGGWFRKGSAETIEEHYFSPELRQIANALDNTIGDLRDTEFVIESGIRQHLGGSGIVGIMSNGKNIDVARINQDVFRVGINRSRVFDNVSEITNWLSSL